MQGKGMCHDAALLGASGLGQESVARASTTEQDPRQVQEPVRGHPELSPRVWSTFLDRRRESLGHCHGGCIRVSGRWKGPLNLGDRLLGRRHTYSPAWAIPAWSRVRVGVH